MRRNDTSSAAAAIALVFLLIAAAIGAYIYYERSKGSSGVNDSMLVCSVKFDVQNSKPVNADINDPHVEKITLLGKGESNIPEGTGELEVVVIKGKDVYGGTTEHPVYEYSEVIGSYIFMVSMKNGGPTYTIKVPINLNDKENVRIQIKINYNGENIGKVEGWI